MAWRDRFRIKLPFADKDKFLSIERAINELPLPGVATATIGSDYAVTSTFADSGFSISFPTGIPGTPIVLFVSLVLNDGGAGWGTVEYRLNIDGQSYADYRSTTGDGTGIFAFSLPEAGYHTVILEVRKSIAAGTVSLESDASNMTVITFVS